MEEDGAAQEVSSRVDHKFFSMFPRASQRFQVNQRCKAHLKVLFIDNYFFLIFISFLLRKGLGQGVVLAQITVTINKFEKNN